MKWLHNLLKGISLTGALFVFQACYGTPQTPLEEAEGFAPMTFSLVSRATGEPLEGIKNNRLDGQGDPTGGHLRPELVPPGRRPRRAI